jgi:hypothetical protein
MNLDLDNNPELLCPWCEATILAIPVTGGVGYDAKCDSCSITVTLNIEQ